MQLLLLAPLTVGWNLPREVRITVLTGLSINLKK